MTATPIATLHYLGARPERIPAADLDGAGLASVLDARGVRPSGFMVATERATLDQGWAPDAPPGYFLRRSIAGLSVVWLSFERLDRRETIAP
jgi:hypothetical protein